MRPLAEQVILITGATDGLGKAVAMQLARIGATLLLHGRDEARGQRTLEEIRAQTGWALHVAADAGPTPEPSQAELAVIREIDPEGFWTR